MLNAKLYRQLRGLSQEQVAEVLGVPRPFVSQFENGVRNPTPEQILALARLLNCSARRLFLPVTEMEASEAMS